MIRLIGKLPKTILLAVSGGPDSMAAYDFLRRKQKVIPVFFNHGSPDCHEAEAFIKDYFKFKAKPIIGKIDNPNKPSNKSLEEYWREERYKFLREVSADYKESFLATAHHLDDQVETYLFSALNGNAKLMKYYNGLVYRPFLLNEKETLVEWCIRNFVPFLNDRSNQDTSKRRNYIRKYLVPHSLKINPGLKKVVMKKTIEMTGELQ